MDIQPTQILFQIINFSILLYAFKRFLFKPILKVLDNRAGRIQEGLEAAEKNIKLQDDSEKEKQKIINQAKKEAQTIVDDAKKEADTVIKEAKAKAKTEAKAVIDKEKTAWQSQMKKQQQGLKTQLSTGILTATQAVLSGLFDQKLQDKVITAQIKKLDLSSIAK